MRPPRLASCLVSLSLTAVAALGGASPASAATCTVWGTAFTVTITGSGTIAGTVGDDVCSRGGGPERGPDGDDVCSRDGGPGTDTLTGGSAVSSGCETAIGIPWATGRSGS